MSKIILKVVRRSYFDRKNQPNFFLPFWLSEFSTFVVVPLFAQQLAEQTPLVAIMSWYLLLETFFFLSIASSDFSLELLIVVVFDLSFESFIELLFAKRRLVLRIKQARIVSYSVDWDSQKRSFSNSLFIHIYILCTIIALS